MSVCCGDWTLIQLYRRYLKVKISPEANIKIRHLAPSVGGKMTYSKVILIIKVILVILLSDVRLIS